MSRFTGKSKETQQTLEKEHTAFVQDKKMLEDSIVDITYSEMSSRSNPDPIKSSLKSTLVQAGLTVKCPDPIRIMYSQYMSALEYHGEDPIIYIQSYVA